MLHRYHRAETHLALLRVQALLVAAREAQAWQGQQVLRPAALAVVAVAQMARQARLAVILVTLQQVVVQVGE